MDRAVAPAVAVALLVAVTVLAASAVGTIALAMDLPDESRHTAVSLSVDATADRLRFTHEGGHALDVTDVSLLVVVDGDPLTDQPPVPFFAAAGFRGGPTGPFNSGADPRWSAGERAAFRVASTYAPSIDSGDVVTVTIRRQGAAVVRVRATAS